METRKTRSTTGRSATAKQLVWVSFLAKNSSYFCLIYQFFYIFPLHTNLVVWAKKCQRDMLTAHIANELIPELERTTSYRAGRFGLTFSRKCHVTLWREKTPKQQIIVLWQVHWNGKLLCELKERHSFHSETHRCFIFTLLQLYLTSDYIWYLFEPTNIVI